MQLTFVVNGEKQLSRNLRLLADDVGDLKSFFIKAIDIVQKRSNDIFTSGGQNLEKSPIWKPLSRATIAARYKRSGYYKNAPNKPYIMRRTGRLQSNVTKTATNKSGTYQYNQPYAVFHQNGGKKLPKRAIIDLSNKTNTDIVKALQSDINDKIGNYGLQV